MFSHLWTLHNVYTYRKKNHMASHSSMPVLVSAETVILEIPRNNSGVILSLKVANVLSANTVSIEGRGCESCQRFAPIAHLPASPHCTAQPSTWKCLGNKHSIIIYFLNGLDLELFSRKIKFPLLFSKIEKKSKAHSAFGSV